LRGLGHRRRRSPGWARAADFGPGGGRRACTGRTTLHLSADAYRPVLRLLLLALPRAGRVRRGTASAASAVPSVSTISAPRESLPTPVDEATCASVRRPPSTVRAAPTKFSLESISLIQLSAPPQRRPRPHHLPPPTSSSSASAPIRVMFTRPARARGPLIGVFILSDPDGRPRCLLAGRATVAKPRSSWRPADSVGRGRARPIRRPHTQARLRGSERGHHDTDPPRCTRPLCLTRTGDRSSVGQAPAPGGG
jgi:hypothetical protein